MCYRQLITLFWLSVAARAMFCQSFQKEYMPANGGFVIPYNAAQRPDGRFLISHSVNSDSTRLYVTCLEPNGAVEWSVGLRAHPDISGDEGLVEAPIVATTDNGCIVMVSKSYQSQVMQQGWALVKLGSDGSVQWNRQMAGVGLLDDFLEHSEGYTFVAARYPPTLNRRYLALLNNDGTALWEKDLSTPLSTIAVSKMQMLPGRRILLMLVTGNATQSVGHLLGVSESGQISDFLSLPDFTFLGACEHPDGRLFFLGKTTNRLLLGALQAGGLEWIKTLEAPTDSYSNGALILDGAQTHLIVSFQGAELPDQRVFMSFDLNGQFSNGFFVPSKEGVANRLIPTTDNALAWVSFSKRNPLRAFVFTKTSFDSLLADCPIGLMCPIGIRDTLLNPLTPPTWKTQDVSRIVGRSANRYAQSINVSDYCADLPVFNAQLFASDTLACVGDTIRFRRDSLAQGYSSWVFQKGAPSAFSGGHPPGVIFLDSGDWEVRHIFEQMGCRDTAWFNIRIEPKPQIGLPPDTAICVGTAIDIRVGGAPDWQYAWSDGVEGDVREVMYPGSYRVTVTNGGGCTDEGTVQVSAIDFPRPPLPSDTLLCEKQSVLIDLVAPLGWQYAWADGFQGLGRLFSEKGVYVLLAESPEGCQLADSIQVDVAPCTECFVYFPNVIKPELGDANGMFGLQTGCNVSAYSIRIYDRWGGLIFEGNQPQQSWNGTYRGKLVPPGVYVFHAAFMLENGGEAKRFSKSGSVAVVR